MRMRTGVLAAVLVLMAGSAIAEDQPHKMRVVTTFTVLADMAEWPAFNDVYRTYFNKPFPARSAVAVRGLAADARVEIECIAAK